MAGSSVVLQMEFFTDTAVCDLCTLLSRW